MRRIIRSEKVKLPRVHRIAQRGRIYKYHRRTRAELPSDVPEDHPAFLAAWAAEESKTPKRPSRAAKGTIGAGCEGYLRSGAYKELSESYRPVIRRHVEAIREQAYNARMTDLRSHHIEQDLDPLTPAVARSRLKAWRKLGAFWKSQGLITDDITLQAKGKKMPKTEGHKEWTRQDLNAFREYWGKDTPQRLACELLQWTGCRSSDAVRIGSGHIDRDGVLSFTQKKTGEPAYVPWFSEALSLEAERETLLHLTQNTKHLVFITTIHGKPRSEKSFSQWFSKAATDAGLPNLSAHGLRKYRMNELAENGASVLQMQSWVGHLTLDEVEHYTRRARRKMAFVGTEQKRNTVNTI